MRFVVNDYIKDFRRHRLSISLIWEFIYFEDRLFWSGNEDLEDRKQVENTIYSFYILLLYSFIPNSKQIFQLYSWFSLSKKKKKKKKKKKTTTKQTPWQFILLLKSNWILYNVIFVLLIVLYILTPVISNSCYLKLKSLVPWNLR